MAHAAPTVGAPSNSFMRLLPRRSTGAASRLEMLAKSIVEGFLTGRHRSPHKGFSVEFAEHRQYVPGDDLRTLDWRVFGKSDRYYIKEYNEETNLRATILLDASASMKYRGSRAADVEGEACSKFEYARYLAAALSYLLINQQDAVGLVTFDTKVRSYVPARSRTSHVRHLLAQLERTRPGGDTSCAGVFHDIAERVRKRGMIIVISDLFDDADAILQALHHFRYCRHELVVLHMMAEEELTFPFRGYSQFRGLEEDASVAIDPQAVRKQYLDNLADHLHRVQTGCSRMKADYFRITTNESFDQALARFLSRRKRGR